MTLLSVCLIMIKTFQKLQTFMLYQNTVLKPDRLTLWPDKKFVWTSSQNKHYIRALQPQNVLSTTKKSRWILEYPLFSSSLFIALTVQITGWDKHLFCEAMGHSSNVGLTQTICLKGTGRNYITKFQNRNRKVTFAIKMIFHFSLSKCPTALKLQMSPCSHYQVTAHFPSL